MWLGKTTTLLLIVLSLDRVLEMLHAEHPMDPVTLPRRELLGIRGILFFNRGVLRLAGVDASRCPIALPSSVVPEGMIGPGAYGQRSTQATARQKGKRCCWPVAVAADPRRSVELENVKRTRRRITMCSSVLGCLSVPFLVHVFSRTKPAACSNGSGAGQATPICRGNCFRDSVINRVSTIPRYGYLWRPCAVLWRSPSTMVQNKCCAANSIRRQRSLTRQKEVSLDSVQGGGASCISSGDRSSLTPFHE